MCEYLIPLDLVFPIAGLRVVGKALCFIRTDCGSFRRGKSTGLTIDSIRSEMEPDVILPYSLQNL